MSKVAATITIMPESPEVDLDALQDQLELALPEGAKISAVERNEVAFGLTALRPTVIVPDDAGGTETVEDAFAGLDNVESVSVENVGRL